MKTNLKKLALAAVVIGLAIAPNAVKASLITYVWSPDTTPSTGASPIGANGVTSSGSLVYNNVSGAITSFSFTYGAVGTDTIYYDSYFGSFVLRNGDLVLTGYSTDKANNPIISWAYTYLGRPDENSANPSAANDCSPEPTIYGDWTVSTGGSSVVTAVPETTTVVAGGLMLLPFGLCVARSLRKNRKA